MRVSDIIKKFAEFLDTVEANKHTSPNQAELTPVEVEQPEVPHDKPMIPPLQQKLELLKKSVGVDSAFDSCDAGHPVDELDKIKQFAGISSPIASIAIAGEDADIE